MLTKLLAVSMIGTAAMAATAGFAPITAPSPARARAADAFKVDAVHSSVVYRIKHNNVAYHYGRFDQVEGTFLLDKDNPSSGSINVSIPVDSVSSGNGGRDGHLKKADFFAAKEFPTITFKSTEITAKGESEGYPAFDVKGDLTLHGVTKPVTAQVRHTGQGSGQKGEVAGIEAKFTIKRSDFGMNFMVGKGLGDDVTIMVSLEGGR